MKKNKKKLFTKFNKLFNAVNSVQDESAVISEIFNLKNNGISVRLKDVAATHTGIYTVLSEGIIKKVALYPGEAQADREPKYHIFMCDNLRNTVESASSKYKIIRRKDNLFKLKIKEKYQKAKTQEKKLNLCLFCLRRLNAQVDAESEIRAENFKLNSFLENENYFNSSSVFTYDYDVIPGYYEKSWQSIAELAKAKSNFTCSKCSFVFDEEYFLKYLQVHYTSREISGKTIDIIKPICVRCHAAEPGHSDIEKIPLYEDFVTILRSRGEI